MSKIKLLIRRSKHQTQPDLQGAGFFHKGRVFSVLAIVLLLALVGSTVLSSFPERALAASGVTITDKVTYPDGIPSTITSGEDVVGLTGKTVNASGTSSSFTESGNTVTFTIHINSATNFQNKTVQPIPAGTYSAASLSTKATTTLTVNSSGVGTATISGGFNCANVDGLGLSCSDLQNIGKSGTDLSTYLSTVCPPGTTTAQCETNLSNTGKACSGINASNAACQSGNNQKEGPNCESSGFTMNWLFCGVYDGLSSASNWMLDNVIMPELNTSPLCLSSNGANCLKNDPTFAIWSNFRIYGDIFLVIALLVVVFGQSIGGGLIDAYTAKKILPRLLGAAVLINLSIYLVAGLVDLTNIIGSGIGALLTEPLKNAGSFTIKPSGSVGVSELSTSLLAGGLLSVGKIAGLFSIKGMSMLLDVVLIPALLVFLSILITIIIRKAAILLLVFVSPIAFALYCLPNTEKYFRKWWSLLTEVLTVYPIIVAMFAISDIMSVTVEQPAASASSASAGINYLLSFLFLIIPLLLIPFSFKLAGDTIGRVHDAVSQGRERVHAMGQGRRERAIQGYQRTVATRSGGMVRRLNDSALGRGINRTPGLGYALGRKVQSADQKARMMGAELSKDPVAGTIQHNDGALRAATYDSYSKAVTGLQAAGMSQDEAKTAARAVQSSIGFGRPQAIWAAQQMSLTGTAFNDIEDVARTIARASGGNATTASSLTGDINSSTKSSGRHDLAPGYGVLNSLVQQERQANITGGARPTADDYSNAAYEAWNSASLYQHANDKPQNIQAAIRHFSGAHGLASGNADEQEQAAVFFNELKAMSPNAVGAVKVEIDAALRTHQPAIDAAISSIGPTASSSATDKTEYVERQVLQPGGSYVKEMNPIGSRQETAAERVDRLSRTFERIDPNRI